MNFAHVIDGQVDRVVAVLPGSMRRTDTGQSISGTPTDPEVLRACGWYPIVHDRPPLKPGEQHSPPEYKVTETTVEAAYVPEPVPPETRPRNLAGLAEKAQAVLADPQRSADWTATETKILLALVALAST